MALFQRVSDALSSSYPKASAELTLALQEQAVRAGWPRTVAQTIKVSSSNGQFVATAAPAADDWEFGTESRPPLSVLRVFNTKQVKQADQVLTKHLDAAVAAWL